MKFGIYLVAGFMIVVIALGAWAAGKRVGIAERDRQAQASLAEWHKRETELLAKLDAGSEKIKVIYRDRIQTIETSTGECLDAALPVDVVNSLR